MTLKVINGGLKASAAANGTGAGGQGFTPHPWAEAVRKAASGKGCDLRTLEQRLSTSGKRRPSRGNIVAALRHNRDHIDEYGWMIPFVRKGPGNALYWVQEGAEEVEQNHFIAFLAGQRSTIYGLETTIMHCATQWDMIADADMLTTADQRFVRRFAGKLGAIRLLVNELAADMQKTA